MKKFLLIIASVAFAFLGLIGLVIPIIPGILFLVLAALCVAAISPRLNTRMRRNPRLARLMNRFEQGDALSQLDRLRLYFWATLEGIFQRRRS